MNLVIKLFYFLKFALLGACVGLLILFFIPRSPLSFNWQEANSLWIAHLKLQQKPVLSVPDIESNRFSYSKAVEKAGPSVVSVQSVRQGRARKAKDGLPGDMLVDLSVGVGSGVIFDKNGFIVTNYHVVAGANTIIVHFSNGRKKYAKVVGFDQQNDIAVIKVDIETPHVAELGRSSEVKTGDVVMAIGTPFGLFENSVTLGIVSAINHGPWAARIQTDASINYGNSGGALINANGQVIGISSAKFSVEKNDEIGINFGAPIDMVKEIFDEILENGRVVRNWFGVDLSPLRPEAYEHFNLGVKIGTGLLVQNVEPKSPGEEAGLLNHDLLISFDGHIVESVEQFRKIYLAVPIGKTVEIEIIRKRETLKMQLKLREKPNK